MFLFDTLTPNYTAKMLFILELFDKIVEQKSCIYDVRTKKEVHSGWVVARADLDKTHGNKFTPVALEKYIDDNQVLLTLPSWLRTQYCLAATVNGKGEYWLMLCRVFNTKQGAIDYGLAHGAHDVYDIAVQNVTVILG